LEYEGNVDDPIPSIQACKHIMETIATELA